MKRPILVFSLLAIFAFVMGCGTTRTTAIEAVTQFQKAVDIAADAHVKVYDARCKSVAEACAKASDLKCDELTACHAELDAGTKRILDLNRYLSLAYLALSVEDYKKAMDIIIQYAPLIREVTSK